ncbi:hypothetical protein IU436_29595 [Nocardia farcinica]|uniref:hypothetical protein n=1 Tax=Nocardia farcinica TaxID=37329 RepID=UPI0018962FFA|nr:hypothetical protein [Nocardia farcinica]MBF6071871.1 hypothetical protein [Nocardia farcinica]MBF6259726.1 hypothetical protein [Nocardia farcinica]MBF6422739.1 hypothetical protein [Nocardia farcinica]MBF6434474.1 hypothetical protein [Nocardia farcinica]MBF6444323.1 hypothetical protein [Nocardia farcinica]
MTEPESLPAVLGRNARRLRIDAGATLEQMASALDDYGVRWSTGRVGDLESGRVAATIPTTIAVALALSQLQSRTVGIAELFEGDATVRINDRMTLHRGALHDIFAGRELTGIPFTENEKLDVQAIMRVVRAETDRMRRFAEKYGDVGMPLMLHAERSIGLAEKRAAEDLGVKPATVAHAAVYMWRRTFSEERDRRAGANASPQKLGQVSRQLKAEIRAALEELGYGDD